LYPVSHGSGSDRSHRPSAYARFSNADGSHLSSLGHALVAERYTGRYGTAYRLDGLDDTNRNLRSRCIVLHGWTHTTSYPIWPLPTIGSWGCPVLSERAMRHVDTILQNANNVVLLAFA
ncbi:MAG: murein L,D-transpeptidase catalytic domain family protein, partial [Alistipes sp.]|nr:murein L,D-transpeptidase catalytic domain family protein [Alistipes sp.]